MKATSALCVLPFARSIELHKTVPNGKTIRWKAEASPDALTICIWCPESEHGRVRITLPYRKCHDDDPVQEMWQRATLKLEQQHFHFVNGD